MKLLDAFSILLLVACVSAPCSVQERLLLNETSGSPAYFIRSTEPVPDAVKQLLTLAKVLGFNYKIPFILDTKLFRSNYESMSESFLLQCHNHSSVRVRITTLMSPVNVSIASILYGCDLHYREGAKIVVINDAIFEDSLKSEFEANYSRFDSRVQRNMCHCNERLDLFIKSCIASPKQGGIALGTIAVFVLFLLIVFSLVVFSGQRNTNSVGVSN